MIDDCDGGRRMRAIDCWPLNYSNHAVCYFAGKKAVGDRPSRTTADAITYHFPRK